MKIVILTNIMTPYRKFFYDEISKSCQKNGDNFYVLLMANTEFGRTWEYENLKTNYTILLPHKTIKIGNIEIHFNKGLKKVYEKIKPDLVIRGGSYLYPAVWETIKLKKFFNYNIIEWSESHLNETRNYGYFKLKMRDMVRKKVISHFDIFWCAGQFSMEFLAKYAKKNSKYIFVPNIIDKDLFMRSQNYDEEAKRKIKSKYDIHLKKKIVFTPARLIPVKGILEFLNIYQKCDIEDAQYIIAGDGELREEIQTYVNNHNLDVKLLGNKSEKEIIELYSIADLFVLPSLSDANPLTCIEACWCKLPLLVSTHVGNYPEIVKQAENGYVFDYKDDETTIHYINEVLNSSKEWNEKAKEISYSIAMDLYNPETAIPRLLKETKEYLIGEKHD